METDGILIAEDEFLVAADLEHQLRNLGYTVAGRAATGDQALHIAGSVHPALVIMDIKLDGGRDGLEIALQLHRDLGIPVIFLTAFAEAELIERAKLSEPFGYLIKPYSIQELRAAIEIALYKSRKERELRLSEIRYRRLQRELYRKLQQAREQERRKIAREIHDELGQNLTALQIELSLIAKKAGSSEAIPAARFLSMKQLVDSALLTVHRVATELRPGVLDSLGLAAAVEWLAGDFQKRTGIECLPDIEPAEIHAGDSTATDLFRVLQEALANAARHAHATRVRVSLKQRDGRITLTVSDNGIGIGAAQAESATSFGLQGLRERMTAAGGTFEIRGARAKGTTLSASLSETADRS